MNRRTKRKYKGRLEKKKPKPVFAQKATKRQRLRAKIISLRGIYCFYCGAAMRTKEITVEHLLARHRGGTNDLHNLFLAHKWCNAEAGSKSVKNKLKLRDMRTAENWQLVR